MSEITKKQHHILIADDEIICQMVYTRILTSKCEFAVTCANNGLEAITKQLEQFSAILMDINMPEMDGITATREIRKNLSLDQLPIIGITADSSSQTQKKCIAAGMNYVTTKPVSVETLKKILGKFNIY